MSAATGLLCAIWSLYSISVLPPRIEARHLQTGLAATDVIVDAPASWILDEHKAGGDFDILAKHADLLGNLISSEPVRLIIARRAGVRADQLMARTRLTGNLVAIMREPNFEQRASQLLVAGKRYRIDVQADPLRPILHVYAQAPTAVEAVRLANATPAGLTQYLRGLPEAATVDPGQQVGLRQLGRARGSVVNSAMLAQIPLLTFLVVFGISWALLVVLGRVRAGWSAAERERTAPDADEPPRLARIVGAVDDWPHTTRVLPWLVVAFLVLLWLVPFNTIQLRISLPFDLKLDRLVLPLLIAMWVLSMAARVKDARRPHLTAIHVAVGAFLAAASLSVVLNAQALNQALEFAPATKKLLLLCSYVCFFLVISSVVRRSEVPAFLRLTLLLAVICALGTIWEYRFHYNVFYDVAYKLLPGNIFSVGTLTAGSVDDIGRSLTRGPGEHPLETTAMLSMALPIALVGLMTAKTQSRRTTILYGLAACLLFAAAISTYRKSALLAPLSVAMTLAYFRRSELLRLAPLAAVAAIVVHFLSPGAFGSIAVQLRPDRLGVGTVSDRTSDYDALRPDVWTHMFFGRGFGSYDHNSYRILDSQILGLLVTVGVVGLACYLLMLVSIVLAARRPIRSQDPVASGAALAIAPAVVAFLVVSFLFDVLEFPHAPYILISLAGLLAVMLKHEEAVRPRAGAPAGWRDHEAQLAAPRAVPGQVARSVARLPAESHPSARG